MRNSHARVNGLLLAIILILVGVGFMIFLSASVGLVARDTGADFKSIIFNQTIFGLIPGLLLMFAMSRIQYRKLRAWSFYLLLFAIFLSCLVFIPGLGFEHGGAKRWISIGSHTFQPSEFLKIAVIVYVAAWFALVQQKAATLKWGTVPFLAILGVTGLVLFSQPDIDTFLVIFAGSTAIYLVAGARFRHLGTVFLIGILTFTVLAFSFPYVRDRLSTFLNPAEDSLGSSYQIQQSLIAVGSGGFLGKGFGKSVQKFNYLPEPIGDSVYAVASEEFGFVGSVSLLLLFFLLAQQTFKIANKVPDLFGKYLAVGIAIMILFQALVNIGAMIGILPLSGITLPFVSHGGTSLVFSLMEAGILLSISRAARD